MPELLLHPDPSTSAVAPGVAVLIPCRDEAAAIGRVVRELREALPGSRIYVYDNNSRDDTVAIAAAAGAITRRVTRQGKGNVLRQMFSDVEADVYVLIDGDGTYDGTAAPRMVEMLIHQQLDMVVGARESEVGEAFRFGHQFGNRLLTGVVAALFGRLISDTLSGYRVFSRRYVKSFPALSSGFEIETELNIHSLELKMPIGEIVTRYGARDAGSASKLKTYRDGWRILATILHMFREERPLAFFGIIGAAMLVLAVSLAVPLIGTYLDTGLVPRLPTAVLVMGLVVMSLLSFVCGLILDTVTRGRRELKRLFYLATPMLQSGSFKA